MALRPCIRQAIRLIDLSSLRKPDETLELAALCLRVATASRWAIQFLETPKLSRAEEIAAQAPTGTFGGADNSEFVVQSTASLSTAAELDDTLVEPM